MCLYGFNLWCIITSNFNTTLLGIALKNNEVIKHSAVIQISNKITLFQRRAWNILLRNAFYDLNNPEVKIFQLPFRDLCEQLGHTHTDKKYTEVFKIMEELIDYKVRWNILGKGGRKIRGSAALLAGFEIVDGVCRYDYSQLLREKLANPDMFARINLTIQNRFSSKHALALYELFTDYKGVKQTPWIRMQDFRELMGLENNEYPEYKLLKYHVISKSIKEINKESDLSIKLDTKKSQRKTSEIKFNIRRKTGYQLSLDLPPIPSTDEIQSLELSNAKELYLSLTHYGCSPSEAHNFIKKYPEKLIESNIKYCISEDEKGNVNNKRQYLKSALERDFAFEGDNSISKKDIKAINKKNMEKVIKDWKSGDHSEEIEKKIENYYKEAGHPLYQNWRNFV
jgi:hypothetical protein